MWCGFWINKISVLPDCFHILFRFQKIVEIPNLFPIAKNNVLSPLQNINSQFGKISNPLSSVQQHYNN